jgi:molecular chaperone DnaK (HSP70)
MSHRNEAAKIAGLQIARFIGKSATASLAYGLDKSFTPRSGPL